MKRLSDVNVLIELVSSRSRRHEHVRAWWERLPDDDVLCICRSVQLSFLRLLTTEAVMREDTVTLPTAWETYARLLASGRFAFVLEPERLDQKWAELCRPFGRSPKVVMDAYIAAFAITGGYTLVTLDRAFTQFKGLAVERTLTST